jgi:hypothetical protein
MSSSPPSVGSSFRQSAFSRSLTSTRARMPASANPRNRGSIFAPTSSTFARNRSTASVQSRRARSTSSACAVPLANRFTAPPCSARSFSQRFCISARSLK